MQSIGDFAEWRISDAWIWCLAASLLWLPVGCTGALMQS
ncbi:hypothetical protein FHY18_000290 [Xanthomonas arboricola]|nr:hypothetical protein [Xanthomonas sp. 3793]